MMKGIAITTNRINQVISLSISLRYDLNIPGLVYSLWAKPRASIVLFMSVFLFTIAFLMILGSNMALRIKHSLGL